MSIFDELRRRQVFKVAVAYAILSWLIAQIASVLVPALRLPDWALSLVTLLLFLGFPVALFLAWAYELSPEGIRHSDTSETRSPGRSLSGRRLDFTIIGLLATALAFVVVDQYMLEDHEGLSTKTDVRGSPSVAVLPFVSISGDPEQDYFSEGISEELLNVLARIPDLHVPSRTSSFSFKGTNASLETIASELGVDHLLEGSVRKEGEQVRISAQLIAVSTNRTLWSASFDRELTSVFEIQDEIATRVADVLQLRLLGASSRSLSRTTIPEAYDAYLQGLAYIATRVSADNRKAIESFKLAIELDPQYAAAYAMLASAYNVARLFDFMDPREASSGAAVAADRALELEPLLARAYFERSQLAQDPATRIADLQTATELGLNDADAYLSQSQLLFTLGRHSEARIALEKAVSFDPRSVQLNWMMGSLRLNLGDRSGARGYYLRSIDLQPASPNAYAGMGDVETAEGRLDEAVKWYVAGLERDPGHGHMTTWVGFLYLSLGDERRAQNWLERGADLLRIHGTAGALLSEFIPLVGHGADPDKLFRLVRGVSPGLFGPFGSRIFRKAIVATNRNDDIRTYFVEFWPELFRDEPEIGTYNFDVVPDVAWILRSEGREDRANALATAALAVFRDSNWAPMYPSDLTTSLIEVEILAALNRDREALQELLRAVDNGWRFGWWQVERDPTLTSIRALPEFQAVMHRIREDVATQLANMPEYALPALAE